MTDRTLDERKNVIRAQLAIVVRGQVEVGLADVQRQLEYPSFAMQTGGLDPLVKSGRFVAKMLNTIGWRRDGWMHTGYDRTPRYVPIGWQ